MVILSGNISLNHGPTHQHNQQCLKEWNIFKSRSLQFIHLNINSLLRKIEPFLIIAKSTNAAIIGISESKLDESVLKTEIQMDEYNFLRCDRKRHGVGVACYIRNNLSYITLYLFFHVKSKASSLKSCYLIPNQSQQEQSIDHLINPIF